MLEEPCWIRDPSSPAPCTPQGSQTPYSKVGNTHPIPYTILRGSLTPVFWERASLGMKVHIVIMINSHCLISFPSNCPIPFSSYLSSGQHYILRQWDSQISFMLGFVGLFLNHMLFKGLFHKHAQEWLLVLAFVGSIVYWETFEATSSMHSSSSGKEFNTF